MADSSDPSPGPPAAPADRPRARAIAEALLDIGAVKLRPADPFTWTSGLVAPIYCDNRLTIAHPAVRGAIRDGFADVLDREALLPATIAGTATAGIPHAAWLSEAVEMPMAYVRGEAKGHGVGAKIEGRVQPGDDVVLVEDLISTGGSALDAVGTLREAGARVRAVLAIFSYRLGAARRAFDEADVESHVLTDFRVLVDVAHAQQRLSDAEREALQAWRADPAAWSVEHGGAHPDA